MYSSVRASAGSRLPWEHGSLGTKSASEWSQAATVDGKAMIPCSLPSKWGFCSGILQEFLLALALTLFWVTGKKKIIRWLLVAYPWHRLMCQDGSWEEPSPVCVCLCGAE